MYILILKLLHRTNGFSRATICLKDLWLGCLQHRPVIFRIQAMFNHNPSIPTLILTLSHHNVMMDGDTEMRNHGGCLQVDIVQKVRVVPGYVEEIHIQAFLESQTVCRCLNPYRPFTCWGLLTYMIACDHCDTFVDYDGPACMFVSWVTSFGLMVLFAIPQISFARIQNIHLQGQWAISLLLLVTYKLSLQFQVTISINASDCRVSKTQSETFVLALPFLIIHLRSCCFPDATISARHTYRELLEAILKWR